MSFHLYPPVTVSTSLPAGISTEAKQDAIIAELQMAPVDYIDSPTGPLLNASVNAIPSGTFLELVASTAAPIKKIQVVDEIGEFMALYTGAAESETLLCGLGLGGSLIEVDLPAGTRITIASLTGSPITAGRMFINFLG
jgi:hypothetical protein